MPFLSSLFPRRIQLQLRSAEASRASGCPLGRKKPGGSPDPLLKTTEVTITANRKRNQTISIRLTPAEKKEITTKAKQAEMTLTDYLIQCSRDTQITVTDLSEMLVELKRIGNNLNQIARKANSRKFFFAKLDSVVEGQRKIYDAILGLKGGE